MVRVGATARERRNGERGTGQELTAVPVASSVGSGEARRRRGGEDDLRRPEMKTTAAWGGSRGSNRAERPHRRVAEALAGSPWPGRGWIYGDDPKGIAGELGSGTAARGLPGRAGASTSLWRVWE